MIFDHFIKSLNEKYIKIKGKKNLYNSKNIIIKYGIDPTSSKLHLGHFLILKKIKNLIKYKNIYAFIIIGNYTALIGDPSRVKERKRIFIKKILYNFNKLFKYLKSFFCDKVKILNNFNWFNNINFLKISNVIVNKLLLRKEIKKKIYNKKNISLGEIIYPFFQSYDNYIVNCNVEIGGEDQEFNMFYVKKFKKCNVIFKILPGIDGKKKMSSTNIKNCIFVDDNPIDIFWKVLKIKDDCLKNFLSFFKDPKKDKKIKILKRIKIDKNLLKKLILFYKINYFLGNSNSIKIIYYFLKKKKQIKLIEFKYNIPCSLLEIISNIFKKSKSYYRRLIKSKSIYLNKKLVKKNKIININIFIIKIGKKLYKIKIN
ncbi:tyrosine--tRNA ligase [Candidatus Vidania fulgoroideorum]